MSVGLKVKDQDPTLLSAIRVPLPPVFDKPEKFTSLTGLLQSTITCLETFSSDNIDEMTRKVSDQNYPLFKTLVKSFRSFQESLLRFDRSDSKTIKELDKLKPTVEALRTSIETLRHHFAPIDAISRDTKSLDKLSKELISNMHRSNSPTVVRTHLLEIEPVKVRLREALSRTEMSYSEDIKKSLEKLERFEDLLSFTQTTPSGTLCLFYKALQVYDPAIHSKIEKIFYQLHEKDQQIILRYLKADNFPDELTSLQATELYKVAIGTKLLESRRDQLLASKDLTLSQLKSNPQLITSPQYQEIAEFNQTIIRAAVMPPPSWDRLYGLFHCTEYPASCFDFFEKKEVSHAGNEILIQMFTNALQEEEVRSRPNLILLLKLMNSHLLDPIRAGALSNQENLKVEVLCRAEYLYALNNIKMEIERRCPSEVYRNIKPILNSLINYLITHDSIIDEVMHQKIRFFIELLCDLQGNSLANFHDTERRTIHYAYLALFRSSLPSGLQSSFSSIPSSSFSSLPSLPSSSFSLPLSSLPSHSSFTPSPHSQFRFQGDFERFQLKFEILEALGGPVLHPSKQSNNLSCMKLLNEMRDQLKQQTYNRETFISKFQSLPQAIQQAIKMHFATYCSVSGSPDDQFRYAEEHQFDEAYFLQMKKSFNLFMQSPEMLIALQALDTSDPLNFTKQVTVKFDEIQSVNLVEKRSYLDELNRNQHNINFQFQILFDLIVGTFNPTEKDQVVLTALDFYQNVPLDISSNCFPPQLQAEDVTRSWDWEANSINTKFSPIFMKIFSSPLILHTLLEKIESSNLPFDAKTAAYARIEKIRATFEDCINSPKAINPKELLNTLFS